MFDIEEELKKLPDKPGVYIMRDKSNTVIYVGKAVVLRNRVRQYFRKNNKTPRIEKMVSLIDHFEYIVVGNEDEALILECNLIKKYRPKFNVLLKDDKTYPYIKVDVKSDYPGVFMTRRIQNDGAKYFGPYPNVSAAKEMVNFIKEKFQIRQCKNFKNQDRACLNYHIKKCLAPCMGYVSKEEYAKQIEQICMLLDGKIDKIIKNLEYEMNRFSENLEFEKAASVRDRILAIERVSEKQKVSNISENNIDVIGLYKNEVTVCIEIFFIRNSKMIGREHYFFDDLKDMSEDEIVSGFIKQYYIDRKDFPSKIMLRYDLEEKQVLENWLSNIGNRKVELKTPQKGEKLRFVEMAELNSKITLENKLKDKTEILTELRDVLDLDTMPLKIESFDISNISGNFIVAGMCVAQNGVIKRNLSRRFKIKTVYGQDDPKCMEEVVTRRLRHSLENPKGGFGTLPDLILADGGITQIRAIKSAMETVGVEIPVFGMVKDDKHSTRALIDENRIEFLISEKLFNFITNLQDEVHKTAIEYHRKVRDKEMTKSKLDYIDGIGEKKRTALLKKFGSVKKIKEPSIEDLIQVKGINLALAEKIKEEL
ncbi:MAG TPA: excinuclease ABC subunit UvrC [Candidatus Scatovivens faecipullorum]|nr:excinuclease ABC subunit UvrC [Candidatus Scatovivens faecipullorum]